MISREASVGSEDLAFEGMPAVAVFDLDDPNVRVAFDRPGDVGLDRQFPPVGLAGAAFSDSE